MQQLFNLINVYNFTNVYSVHTASTTIVLVCLIKREVQEEKDQEQDHTYKGRSIGILRGQSDGG